MKMRRFLIAAALIAAPLTALADAPCGGSFSKFVQGLKTETIAKGIDAATADAFFNGVKQDPAVLRADRKQGVFQIPFVDFSRRLISNDRINRGRANGKKYDAVFDRIEKTYGVDRGVLLAFWAFETDYGSFQGDFNTANALITLAHDCRRPELFRPQVIAAVELFAQGGFDPKTTTGAWAGEIGMVQMLPRDILENGVDGDGDGIVSLKTSAADALMSGAKMLHHLGWRAGEPWLDEVSLPQDFDWSLTGLDVQKTTAEWQAMGVAPRNGDLANGLTASLLLPQGRGGPAFIAYPNFRVYFEWNQSFTYVLTAAYFATRLQGAKVFDAGNPEPGLEGGQMKLLQTKLQNYGYDVGEIDGILGAKTRAAVRKEQARLGLPVDGWPTPALLAKL
ncbi:lytic murein transglycosylase [Sulfitobacter mediterraneus]|nr:lytic murein transglycosylase [Sulfitobacter mediterraneus]MBM1633400.1 lytic murein transglycosylase [Sulfitobacter mediterraneus]MBM1640466.1 lytic murein transglycosylase [Sulfitobacter mediterraneus]MBM1645265.1 lytic murein transglycosylase [Sulfitobacter mediterraneus]MBM1648586.1 lytic murein transglycosylase [Sulfitobacter mediterraneus]MBM1652606.1 lytic murein transglycosylase [Sulfitobacter mediterraneus]